MFQCPGCHKNKIGLVSKLQVVFDGDERKCPNCKEKLVSVRFSGLFISFLGTVLGLLVFPLVISKFGLILGLLSIPLVAFLGVVLFCGFVPMRLTSANN